MFTAIFAATLIQAAPSPADLADAKCAVALMTHGKQVEDAVLKLRFAGASLFYVGKILGRSGEAMVKDAINAIDPELDPKEAASLAKACHVDAGRTIDAI